MRSVALCVLVLAWSVLTVLHADARPIVPQPQCEAMCKKFFFTDTQAVPDRREALWLDDVCEHMDRAHGASTRAELREHGMHDMHDDAAGVDSRAGESGPERKAKVPKRRSKSTRSTLDTTCAPLTDMVGETGTLASNEVGTEYGDDAFCAWVIEPVGTQGECVKLTFSADSVVEADYDFVHVYAGEGPLDLSALSAGTYDAFEVAANELTGGLEGAVVTVNSARMVVVFETDSSVGDAGFRATYSLSSDCVNAYTPGNGGGVPMCSGMINSFDSMGSMSSSNGDIYEWDLSCLWNVHSVDAELEGLCVTLEVWEVDLADGDELYVYDAAEVGAGRLLPHGEPLTGTLTEPLVIHTSGPGVAVHFESGFNNDAHTGFDATWYISDDCLAVEPTCARRTVLTDPLGFLDSNPDDDHYMAHSNCTWIIAPPEAAAEGQCITLTVEQLGLAHQDYVAVYDGDDVGRGALLPYATALVSDDAYDISEHAIVSSGASLTVHLSSQGGRGSGFVMSWALTSNCTTPEPPQCDGTVTLTASSGVILNTLADGEHDEPHGTDEYDVDGGAWGYESNRHCIFHVRPTETHEPSEGPKCVRVSWTAMRIDPTDRLAIHDGDSVDGPVLPNAELPLSHVASKSVLSHSPSVTVEWRTDVAFVRDGFDLSYEVVDECAPPPGTPSCSGVQEVSGVEGTVESNPFHPHYDNGVDCMWVLRVPDGMCMHVSFAMLDTEANADVVYVHDGDTVHTSLLSPSHGLSGSTLPEAPYWSSGSAVTVHFRSDASITAPGFELHFEATETCNDPPPDCSVHESCEECTADGACEWCFEESLSPGAAAHGECHNSACDPVGLFPVRKPQDAMCPSQIGVLHELDSGIGLDWHLSASDVANPLAKEHVCALPNVECSADQSVITGLTLNSRIGSTSFALPASLSQLSELRKLRIHGAPASDLPRVLAEMSHLEHLELVDSSFRGTLDLTTLTALRVLRVERALTDDQDFPIAVRGMHALEELYLIDLPLARGPMPAWLHDISTLRVLTMRGVHLRGGIPQGLASLPVLEELDLSNNALSGQVPSGWGALRRIALSSNQLSGSLPRVENHVHLESVHLDHNSLSGDVPPELFALPTVIDLVLSHNQLSGTLPASLAALGAGTLLEFSVERNRLHGELPHTMNTHALTFNAADNQLSGELRVWPGTRLRSVRVAGNLLTGELPAAMMTEMKETLAELDVSRNALEGTLPSEMSELSELQLFRASENQLHGTIERALCEMAHLRELDLSNNALHGVIPYDDIDTSVPFRMETLRLGSNTLTGTIPVTLSHLSSLVVLALDNNDLHGTIPPELVAPSARMDRLFSIDLSGNRLSGTVPRDMGALMMLAELNLSDNELHGRLTDLFTTGAFAGLQRLQLSNNALSGPLPDAVRKLEVLALLELNNNLLTGTIPQLGNEIQEVVLASNQFDTLSCEVVQGSPFLRILDVSKNRIGELRAVELDGHTPCGTASSLRLLDLSNNELVHRSGDLFDSLDLFAPRLRSLDLSNNTFGSPIPLSLGNLAELDTLRLVGAGMRSEHDLRCIGEQKRCLPRFTSLGSQVQFADTYKCYVPRPNAETLLLDIEWNDYFDNLLCYCNEEYFGIKAECHECAENGDCVGRELQHLVLPKPGYWGDIVNVLERGVNESVCNPTIADEARDIYVRCRSSQKERCRWSIDANGTPRQCVERYDGRLCSGCEDGYFAYGDKCRTCPSHGVSVLMVCGFSLGVLLLITYLYKVQRKATGMLKILLFFLQMTRLLANVGVPVDASLNSGSMVAGAFSLVIPGLECLNYAFDYHERFWSVTLAPPVLLVLVSLVWLAGVVRGRADGKEWYDINVRVFLFLLFTKYLNLSNTVLRTLPLEGKDRCRDEVYFLHFPHIPSSTPSSKLMYGAAWTFFFVYVIGIPLYFVVQLARKRKNLDEETTGRRLGFIYQCYRPEYWHWEAVIAVRRLCVAIVVAANTSSSPAVPFFVFLVLMVSLVLQRKYRPYSDPIENSMEYWTLIVLCANFSLVMMFFSPDLGDNLGKALAALLIAVDLAVILVLAFFMARSGSSGGLSKVMRRVRSSASGSDVWSERAEDGETLREKSPALLGGRV